LLNNSNSLKYLKPCYYGDNVTSSNKGPYFDKAQPQGLFTGCVKTAMFLNKKICVIFDKICFVHKNLKKSHVSSFELLGLELKPSHLLLWTMANKNWFQTKILNNQALEKVHCKSPFCESTYDCSFCHFLVVCSSDTYAPIKPSEASGLSSTKPHEAYSKTQTKQEGSKKVDIKVIPPKVQAIWGRERPVWV
jgi:hypothetical protein